MEKKLTDEEIVKALDCCAVGRKCGECPYCIKKIDCLLGQRIESDLLDLIHRLQDENERLSLIAGMIDKGVAVEIVTMQETIDKQKAEIERLASVNMQTIGKNADLQMKVYELKAYAEDVYKKAIDREEDAYSLGFDKGKEQAVKDTAKEIYSEINSCIEKGQEYCGLDWRGLLTAKTLILVYCKKKGVEVE